MINPLLDKLYGLMLEKKISSWVEIHDKRANEQDGFYKTHLIILRIITKIIKTTRLISNELLCWSFRKYFDTC